MKEWILEFIKEVDTIDEFFVEQLQQYVNKFVTMQTEFLKKLEIEQRGRSSKN